MSQQYQIMSSFNNVISNNLSHFQYSDPRITQDNTSVEISNKDKFFHLVQDYLVRHGTPSHYSITYGKSEGDEDGVDLFQKDSAKLGIGYGIHSIEFEGEVIFVNKFFIGSPVSTFSGTDVYDALVIFVRGKGKEELIRSFCQKIYDESTALKDKFSIFSWNICSQYWAKTATKKIRDIKTLVLPDQIKNDLLNDIEDFVSEESVQWYRNHGLPYKRSYLLYGPPGSGKSSFVQIISGLIKRNVYFLQPSHPDFTDDTLRSAITQAASKSIIVLEDIDALFDHERNNKSDRSPLTFSGLLNALDGVPSVEGHIFFLTSNFIEKLDFALIRDGRVDYRVEFPSATKEQMERIFLNFYPEKVEESKFFAECVLREMGDKAISMATLQNHFIKHRKSNSETAKHFEKPVY